MRKIFGGSIKLGPGLGPAIVAFDLWIGALVASPAPVLETARREVGVWEVIASVAETVAAGTGGLEKDLLKKAVEETLFTAAGQNMEISARVAQSRWVRYIKVHGQQAMIEMFLANHLWSVLWLETGDLFGPSDNRRTEYMLRRLRRTCRLLVNSVCQSRGLHNPVSLSVAEQVVGALETSISPS